MKFLRFLIYVSVAVLLVRKVSATGVFRVQHKFSGKMKSLDHFKVHDELRHGRILSTIDLPMGGTGLPSKAGLYFARIGIGTPTKDYYVQIDTGSDIFWVNCVECTRCPKKSDLGVPLTLYDGNKSSTGKIVTCDQPFCSSTYDGQYSTCPPGVPCKYSVLYGDGSTTSGYYVNDTIQYNQASGNLQTAKANASVVFGCGAAQSGDLGSSGEALDGILGFGQANSSMISQLASAGKVKKMFAHCLDGTNGGGIFAIGDVIVPDVMKTPLVPNQPHYNVNMKAIEVGGRMLNLPTDVFDSGSRKGTIIDSGTTLAYFPDVIFKPLVNEIMSYQQKIELKVVQNFLCFGYLGSVDDAFPSVTLHFQNSSQMKIHPRDYLFQISRGDWCIGWQNSGMQSKDAKDMILLGDLVLTNKLVLYDLENQVIGWTEYNCSSSIKVKDKETGAIYSLSAHDISPGFMLEIGRVTLLLLLTTIFLHVLY